MTVEIRNEVTIFFDQDGSDINVLSYKVTYENDLEISRTEPHRVNVMVGQEETLRQYVTDTDVIDFVLNTLWQKPKALARKAFVDASIAG